MNFTSALGGPHQFCFSSCSIPAFVLVSNIKNYFTNFSCSPCCSTLTLLLIHMQPWVHCHWSRRAKQLPWRLPVVKVSSSSSSSSFRYLPGRRWSWQQRCRRRRCGSRATTEIEPTHGLVCSAPENRRPHFQRQAPLPRSR